MSGHGPRRDPVKERFWREMLRRQQASGVSIREFCGRKRLTESAFYAWRAEIQRRDRQAARTIAPQRRRAVKPNRPRFLPVALANGHAASALNVAASLHSVEITMPSGIVLRLGGGCDRRIVRAVLGAVLRQTAEASTC
jgi:hypothetical protein